MHDFYLMSHLVPNRQLSRGMHRCRRLYGAIRKAHPTGCDQWWWRQLQQFSVIPQWDPGTPSGDGLDTSPAALSLRPRWWRCPRRKASASRPNSRSLLRAFVPPPAPLTALQARLSAAGKGYSAPPVASIALCHSRVTSFPRSISLASNSPSSCSRA